MIHNIEHFPEVLTTNYVQTVQNSTRFLVLSEIHPSVFPMWGGDGYIVGANQAGKRASSLFNCISVTDDIKINEQYKPIAKGPLYVQAEFGAGDLSIPAESYSEFEHLGGIGRCDTGTEHVQDPEMYYTIEEWCSMKCRK